MNFETIYQHLEDIYAEESFHELKQLCKQVAVSLRNYPEPIYYPVKFDSDMHEISSTTATDYLQLLTDEDVNAHLKKFRPVKIMNDGSAIFRAVASLLGFPAENHVRELRLRCLVNALAKLTDYINDNRELLESLYDPERISSSHWSNFVHEKELVSEISSHCRKNK